MPLSGARHVCRCVGGRRKGRGGSRGEEWALVSHSWRPGRAGRLQVAAQAGGQGRCCCRCSARGGGTQRRRNLLRRIARSGRTPPRVRHPLPGSALLLLLRVVALRRSESSPAPSSPPGADSEGAFLAPTGLPAPPPPLPLLPVTAEARSLARSLAPSGSRAIGALATSVCSGGSLRLPVWSGDCGAASSSVRPSVSLGVSQRRGSGGEGAAGGGLSSLPLAAAGPRPGHLRWAATKAPSGRGGPGHGVPSRQGGVVPRGGLS